MLRRLVLGVASVLLLAGAQAKATTLVYDNGAPKGTIDAWVINGGGVVTDSFTLSSTTTLTEAQVGLWDSGSDPMSLDWSIGTSAFGTDVDSVSGATLNSTATGNDAMGVFPIFESTFSLDVTLGPGTYWLTLQNAVGGTIFWDQTNGPSSAEVSGIGSVGSESFQLYSGSASVPEISGSGAGSLAVLLLGAIALLPSPRRIKSL